jgi:hypothetical protein
MATDPQYRRVLLKGKPATARQKQAILAAERYIQEHYPNFEFLNFQGSWQPQTDYSGSSHTGAGVVDLEYAGIGYTTPDQKEKYRFVLRALRDVGKQAAFGRGPWNAQIDGTGAMPLHFHTCDLDTTGAAQTVVTFQVPEYRLGNDGLYAGHKDVFPFRPDPIRKWRFR